MPRLRNIQTGAVVSVSDETAARLDDEWVPAEKAAPVKKTVAKKAAASKTEK